MTNQSGNSNYHSLLKNALVELKKMHAELDALEKGITEPIAIVGMSCRFPGGANSPQAYWDLLHNGIDAITEIPGDRWDVEAYYDPDPNVPGKMYTRYGAFLKNVADFDPQFFEISPREAHRMDPQQRLLLEVTWEALENSGIAADKLKGTQTGVFMGVCFDDYAKFNVKSENTARIEAYDALGNFRSVAAGRISYFLGLQGPTMQLDTTCSSALLGIHLACQSLRTKESNLALAGGVNLMLEPGTTVGFCKLKALSADGKCKTFDAAANGYVRGEGCGIVVLKRLSDAVADGDYIHAVIKGSAANHDGHSNGLTAPNGSAQEALLRQVLEQTKIKPEEIQYVEAHGTGTSLGDPIEVSALGRVLGKGRKEDNPLIIGSVKTNFGHLETAAGIAGVMKVVLSLQNREIPPHLHLKEPNPYIPWNKYPLLIPTEPLPWPAKQGTRLGGVSSFGMSGTNVHVILEQAPEPVVNENKEVVDRSHHILTLSAKNEAALLQMSQNYLQFLESHRDQSLADICFTANVGRSHFEHRLSIVVESTEQLKQQLKAFSRGKNLPEFVQGTLTNKRQPKIAFLFTGQGSQYVGMGRQLFESQPVFRAALLRCDTILRSYLNKSLVDEILYPQSEQTSPLDETIYTQPSLFAFEYALAEVWQSWGIKPDVVTGHSLGEYVAACIAGVFSLEDALKLVFHRARLMQALPANGEMVAVFASEAQVNRLIDAVGVNVAVAGVNGPENTVISGHRQAIAQLMDTIEEQGLEIRKLNVARAFHSSMMDSMLGDFRQVASQISYKIPKIDIVSNVTGELATDEIATADYWCRHIRLPVQFAKSMKTLDQKGYGVFLEIGAKPILLGMGRQCLADDSNVWLPSVRWGYDNWLSMLQSLSQLYVRGVTVDWTNFDHDYSRHKVILPTYPFQHQRYWVDPPELSSRPHLLPTDSQTRHPLLGQQLRLPFSKEIRFESQFSPNSPSFIRDHELFGLTIVPAASHIATALASVKEAFSGQSCVLEDLLFPQALVLEENNPKTVQVLLTPEATDVYSWQIIGLDSQTNENQSTAWKLHSTGKMRLTPLEGEKTLDIAMIQAQYQKSLSKAEFYQLIWDLGYTLGSAFQWNHQIWRRAGEVLSQIEVPSTVSKEEVSQYQLYPGLIDSCLQLLLELFPYQTVEAAKNGDIYLPFIIEQFKFYQSPHGAEQLWCHAKNRKSADNGEDKVIGDISLFNETGVIAEIIGFELRKANQALLQQELRPKTDQLQYEMIWMPQEREQVQVPLKSNALKDWLIFCDRQGIGQQVAKHLSDQGINCTLVFADAVSDIHSESEYIIDPNDAEGFKPLLEDHQFAGILHLWSLDNSLTDTTTLTQIEQGQKLGCASVLHLVQALFEHEANDHLPRLCLVTQGAMSVGDMAAPLNVGQASLWGLGKVIALEHPDLQRLLIDLDQVSESISVSALVNEILSPEKDDQIAFRQDRRYVARLVDSTRLQTVERQQFNEDGSYLITGGLGALGIEVAQTLAALGVRHLILTSRGQVSVSGQKAIKQLEESGVEVLIAQADVSDFEAISQVFAVINREMPPLRGVIQAAGVLEDGLVLRQNWSSFQQVMAPKVAGTWNLHQLTKELSLDFFLCFSSVASLIGSPGQGNYAAANAFMDALCHHRRALGLPGSSINWGPWADQGMAAQAPQQWQQLLSGWGFQPLAIEQGLEALEQILSAQPVQIGVVCVDWSKFIGQFAGRTESPLFSEVASVSLKPDNNLKATRKGDFIERLQKTVSENRQKMVIAYLQEQLAAVLKFDSSQQFNAHQGFFEMGIDSLMTIELKNRLEADIDRSLPSTLLFKYPTLESLAEYLVDQLVESDESSVSEHQSQPTVQGAALTDAVNDVEQLSEEEAEALLLAKLETL